MQQNKLSHVIAKKQGTPKRNIQIQDILGNESLILLLKNVHIVLIINFSISVPTSLEN